MTWTCGGPTRFLRGNELNRFLEALEAERPLQIVGTINAYTALQARDVGFRCLYVSGAGVANAAFGLPDLAMTSLTEVATEVRRIVAVSDLPVLVDVDTGFGDGLGIGRTVDEMIHAGAAAIHIEDQVAEKRCGHRLGKALVDTAEMVDRLRSATTAVEAARQHTGRELLIIARTDALADEGLDAAVARSQAYEAAGADAIFFEAATSLDDYAAAVTSLGVPVLANMTEFGVSPLLSRDQLAEAGVAMVLYPLTAFRAMSAAATSTYATIRAEGTQASIVGRLQTRADLYRLLGYEEYERRMDQIIARDEAREADE